MKDGNLGGEMSGAPSRSRRSGKGGDWLEDLKVKKWRGCEKKKKNDALLRLYLRILQYGCTEASVLQDAEIDGAERVVIGPVYPLVITRNAGGEASRNKEARCRER